MFFRKKGLPLFQESCCFLHWRAGQSEIKSAGFWVWPQKMPSRFKKKSGGPEFNSGRSETRKVTSHFISSCVLPKIGGHFQKYTLYSQRHTGSMLPEASEEDRKTCLRSDFLLERLQWEISYFHAVIIFPSWPFVVSVSELGCECDRQELENLIFTRRKDFWCHFEHDCKYLWNVQILKKYLKNCLVCNF